MKRLFQLAVTIGVASAVPASPLVLAQIQEAAAPAQKVEVKDAIKVMPAAKAVFEKKVVNPQGKVEVVREVVVREFVVQKDAVVNQNLEPQIRQFMQQFRPAMRSEYYFIRSVCAPTPEQRTKIAHEGEKALRDASKAFVEAQRRPAQIRNGRAMYPDPRKLIEEAMARAVASHLTPDQAARYAAESEKRTADRRQAAARNIVAKLDQDLVLSPEQRTKIVEAMTGQWDESWCQSLETLLYGDQYYPRLPDVVVVPHLDEKQTRVWQGSRPNQNFFSGFVGNMMPQEDPREDKELIEARQAAEKDQPPLPARRAAQGLVPARRVPPGLVEVEERLAPAMKVAPVAKRAAPIEKAAPAPK